MPWCCCWNQRSPAVTWHPAQGKKLCQCLNLAGWLSAGSALAGLEPGGHHCFAVNLLRRAFSLGLVQRAGSSAVPVPVLMLGLHMTQKSMGCMGEEEEHRLSCHGSSSGLLYYAGYLIFLTHSLYQRGSRKSTWASWDAALWAAQFYSWFASVFLSFVFPLLLTGISKKGAFAEASFEKLVPTWFCFEPKWANE